MSETKPNDSTAEKAVDENALGLVIGIVPKPAQPAVRWGLGLCVLLGAATYGFSWLDGRVDGKIARISAETIEAKAIASEKTTGELRTIAADHEKRLTSVETDGRQTGKNISDMQGDMKAIRQMLDDRLPPR